MKKTTRKKSPISQRMRRGELYVAYGGMSEDYTWMSLLSYGDRERTPRIYAKHAVDGRLDSSLPICRTLATVAALAATAGRCSTEPRSVSFSSCQV